LKTTGALEIEVLEVVFEDEDGSRRLAYRESPPPFGGLEAEGLDISVGGMGLKFVCPVF
jgi:hypothetical protein